MPETITLKKSELDTFLREIKHAKICAIGDVCLDCYLFADMKLSELSRETPHFPLPIVKEVFSLGGGGNLIDNINALGIEKLVTVAVIGQDWRGDVFLRLLEERKIDTSHIIKSRVATTNAYCKPMRMGISDVIYEDPRLDFENRRPLSKKDEDAVLDALNDTARNVDVIAVADQLKFGIVTEKIRERLSEIGIMLPVIVDSRDRAGLYKNVIIKPNEVEAAALLGYCLKEKNVTLEEYKSLGIELNKKNDMPVIITLGSIGSLWCENGKAVLASTIKAKPPVNIVGAGDTFLSALASAYAVVPDGAKAIAFANLASAVTVKKINTTGTATCDEIKAKYEELYPNE